MGSINEFKDLFRAMVLRNCNGELLREYTKNDKVEDYVQKLIKDFDERTTAQAFEAEVVKAKREYFKLLMDAGQADDVLPFLVHKRELEKDIKDKEDKKFKTDFIFLTVNPRSNVLLSDFVNICHKCVNKSYIKQFLYVIEQRGESEDELGKGFHAHFLINKGDYRPSHFNRDFASNFKKVCDVDNMHCFNVQLCKPQDVPKRQNYITSIKDDVAKHTKQQFDKIFRKKYAIKDYYGELYKDDCQDVK